MRKLFSALLLLLLATPAWGQVTIAPKPADGPLATVVKALPDVQAVKEFRSSTVGALGKLAPFDVSYGGKTYHIEMKRAPTVAGDTLEILARVSVDGVPKGIGKSLVEWERIRIHGPPLLVPDGTFHQETDPITGDQVNVANFTEDPGGALKQDLAHTFSLIVADAPPIPGTVGHTTDTFYPDPNPETTSVDGTVYRSATNETWANIIGSAGSGKADTNTTYYCLLATTGLSGTQFNQNYKCILGFDTSAIDDGDNIDSATLSLYDGGTVSNTCSDPGTFGMQIVAATPASNTVLAAGDYSNFGSTTFSTAISIGSWSTVAYNDFILNASGRANITTTGVSNFGAISPDELTATFSPTCAASNAIGWKITFADQTGTSTDPKLVVEHSVGGGSGVMLGAPF